MAERFLEQCRSNPAVVKRLRENPELVDSVVEIYKRARIERLLAMRNVGGMGGNHGGPQLALYSKMFGARFISHMARVLGPCAYTDDPGWALADGMFEVGQRSGICLAPGGTPEAYKIGISRSLRIGR